MDMDEDPLIIDSTSNTQSTITSWADDPDLQNLKSTDNPPYPQDIRNISSSSEQKKLLALCDELNQCERAPTDLVNLFIRIKKELKSLPKSSLQATFIKIKHRDRDFFRTFTKNNLIKPKHQSEYEVIEKEFHNNYLKTNNLGYITRTTKKKIRIIINKAIFVSYLRSNDITSMRLWQVAQLLEYAFNFFIDPSLPKINYQDLYETCENLIKMKLPDLPENPSDIPSAVKIKLPRAIPITSSIYTSEIAGSLRAYYNFDLLPEAYFLKKPNLPNSPNNLRSKVNHLFPLTSRSQLRDLKELTNELREFYYVPSKLPESYFELPPPKTQLPSSYKELPANLAKHFPTPNDPEVIKFCTELLRSNNYAVRRLPTDFIRVKRPLPPVYWYSENNSTLLPVILQEDADALIKDLNSKYFFKLPLGPEWIKENLTQTTKPKLPVHFSAVEEELGISKGLLDRDHPAFEKTIRTIKSNYQGEIPREWISLLLPDLSDLESTKNILEKRKIKIELPFMDNNLLDENVKHLRKYFHFEKLPDEFLFEPESPEPDWTLLPRFF